MRSHRSDRIEYRPSAGSTGRAVAEGEGAQWHLGDRLDRLVHTFGNNRLADLLDVSASQPSRWRRGTEALSPASQRRLLDLDYIVARLLQLFPAEQAGIWLTSHNAHLGARPVDVLRMRGAGPVIGAIDAEAQGAFV